MLCSALPQWKPSSISGTHLVSRPHWAYLNSVLILEDHMPRMPSLVVRSSTSSMNRSGEWGISLVTLRRWDAILIFRDTKEYACWLSNEQRRKRALDYSRIDQLGKSFNVLHEGTRHTVHSSETLKAAIQTITRIQEQQAKLPENVRSKLPGKSRSSCDSSQKDGKVPERTQLSSDSFQIDEEVADFFEFQLCKLQNLLLRSKANHERLCSEVSLVRFSQACKEYTNPNLVRRIICLLWKTPIVFLLSP